MDNEYITISDTKLHELLELHKKWVDKKSGGARLDLSNVDLSNIFLCNVTLENANLENANLSNISLINTNLRYANLKNANLYHANLYQSDLSSADLTNADMRYINLEYSFLNGANLYNANLENADLENSDLYGANLEEANLDCADLEKATLCGANLHRANLANTNLIGANLYKANLEESQQFRKGVILDKKMIGYKKCRNGVIVTLEIPKGAIVFSINGYKCRTNKAKCIDISNGYTLAYSSFDEKFTYEIGKTYTIKNFNLIYNIECGEGIHFFRNKEYVKDYNV